MLPAAAPEWRNWHTQGTQNPPASRPCGFESRLRHRPCEAHREPKLVNRSIDQGVLREGRGNLGVSPDVPQVAKMPTAAGRDKHRRNSLMIAICS